MIRNTILALCALALTAFGAAYHVTISSPTWVGTNELMPGDYKVEVQGDKAIIKLGKSVFEAPAKLETANSKFPVTSLHTTNADGKTTLDEIWVGGTPTKIVIMK